MTKKTLTLAMIFVFAHIAFVAPFVPSKNILLCLQKIFCPLDLGLYL